LAFSRLKSGIFDSPMKATLLLGILLSFVGRTQGLTNLEFGTDSTLEVVTWNVENFPLNGNTTRDSVALIITSLDADIYALQEISDTNFFKAMANLLPDYVPYIESNWYSGLAFLYKPSTVNITADYEIYYTQSYWNWFPRSPVVLEIEFNGKEVIVINNHLKCCGEGILDYGNSSDEEYRRFQANNFLEEYISTNHQNDRVLVVGDLNDRINDPWTYNVFQTFLEQPEGYKFADSAIAAGSAYNWSFPAYPSHLDHILINWPLFDDFDDAASEVKTIRIQDALAGGWTYYANNISDHLPVGIRLKLRETYLKIGDYEIITTVFPNPTSDLLHIKSSNKWKSYRLLSITGEICQEGAFQQQIDISNQKTGVYILEIQFDEQLIKKKVIKT
jgi:endonuclease/exonuclease/phosphatase family metal-dependent hydrolase